MSHPGTIFKAARAAFGLSQEALADAVSIEVRTLIRLETEGHSVSLETIQDVRSYFEGKGFEFLPETPDFGAGLRLPKPAPPRKLADKPKRKVQVRKRAAKAQARDGGAGEQA